MSEHRPSEQRLDALESAKELFERIQRNVDDDGDFIGVCKERLGAWKCGLPAGHAGKHKRVEIL